MNKYFIIGLAATSLTLGSCSKARWSAEGTLTNAPENAQLILEAPNAMGQWYPMDTVKLNAKGEFKVKGEPVGHPEVFRLTLNGQSAYFPIDSLDHVTIQADASHMAAAKIDGSESAQAMQRVNDLINKVAATKGEAAVSYDPDLKRALSEQILRNPSGVVAYYTIFKRVGQTPVYNPTEHADLRIIGAVANAYTQLRPNDPRTALLKTIFLSNRRAKIGSAVPTDTISAQIVELPEIALRDAKGQVRSLTEVASHGKVVVLSFTAYGVEGSPALNVELAKLYNANRANGLEIYQVAVDDDEFQWRQAAKNLPWITVYSSPKDGGQALIDYNVGAIPTHFVINRQGQLVERVDNPTRLASTVARYL